MSILKCKMCGGELNIVEGTTVCECEYCGSKQTIPSLDNEKKTNLFNRANRLRFNNEFDKASGIYESIVSEFPEEAEAYWGLLLCKYGIEYVDDPSTSKKIPTCHRANYTSIFDDENFELCLEYSDSLSKEVYRNEAKEIDRIQKSILDVASKEAPFDVFICYKETDENGDRTKDSVLAQDIYDKLTEKGYKVFFSRITLEDKLGQEYEPYIFSALNSAKVMLAIGTKYEYYDSIWVKNEWSRFLDLMKSNKDKVLIPCYADIDAYDLPKEFKNLQGQEMNKLGFIQDLVRGVESIISNPTQKASKTANKKLWMTLLPILMIIVIVTSLVMYNTQIKPNSIYKKALLAYQQEDYELAKNEFGKIPGYKASSSYIELIDAKCNSEKTQSYTTVELTNAEAGDFVKYGQYRDEDIIWRVIKISNDNYSLLCESVFDIFKISLDSFNLQNEINESLQKLYDDLFDYENKINLVDGLKLLDLDECFELFSEAEDRRFTNDNLNYLITNGDSYGYIDSRGFIKKEIDKSEIYIRPKIIVNIENKTDIKYLRVKKESSIYSDVVLYSRGMIDVMPEDYLEVYSAKESQGYTWYKVFKDLSFWVLYDEESFDIVESIPNYNFTQDAEKLDVPLYIYSSFCDGEYVVDDFYDVTWEELKDIYSKDAHYSGNIAYCPYMGVWANYSIDENGKVKWMHQLGQTDLKYLFVYQ